MLFAVWRRRMRWVSDSLTRIVVRTATKPASPARVRRASECRRFPVKTALGLVSRVSPVHTAVRNCTRDEGGPFEIGNQVLISSHRKLLSSKAMVVNVAEKSEQDFDRYD